MLTKNDYISKTVFSGLELVLFFLILCGAAIQVVFGQNHILFQLLRLFYAPGMIFLAGLYASHGSSKTSFLLKHSAIYAVLFIFLGLCNQVLINHKNPFQSFVRLITMQRIPTPSEMFFTAAVLFLCSALAANYIEYLHKRTRLLLAAGILAVFVSFFPADIFKYPFIGVFTGCNIYDCTALLPYLGYFIAGTLMGKSVNAFSKKLLAGCAAITSVSAVLTVTPLKPAALVMSAALPVYILYLFCVYCAPYRKLAEWVLTLKARIITIQKNWYRDFIKYINP